MVQHWTDYHSLAFSNTNVKHELIDFLTIQVSCASLMSEFTSLLEVKSRTAAAELATRPLLPPLEAPAPPPPLPPFFLASAAAAATDLGAEGASCERHVHEMKLQWFRFVGQEERRRKEEAGMQRQQHRFVLIQQGIEKGATEGGGDCSNVNNCAARTHLRKRVVFQEAGNVSPVLEVPFVDGGCFRVLLLLVDEGYQQGGKYFDCKSLLQFRGVLGAGLDEGGRQGHKGIQTGQRIRFCAVFVQLNAHYGLSHHFFHLLVLWTVSLIYDMHPLIHLNRIEESPRRS